MKLFLPATRTILAACAVLLLASALAVAQNRGGARITIKGGAFQPATVTVQTGDTVTWTNSDDRDHAITGDGFRSDNLSPGASFDNAFKKAGTYSYACKLHPRERGVVVVKD